MRPRATNGARPTRKDAGTKVASTMGGRAMDVFVSVVGPTVSAVHRSVIRRSVAMIFSPTSVSPEVSLLVSNLVATGDRISISLAARISHSWS